MFCFDTGVIHRMRAASSRARPVGFVSTGSRLALEERPNGSPKGIPASESPVAEQRLAGRRSPCATLTGAALWAGSAAAEAAAPAPAAVTTAAGAASVEEVVVTGFRGSLEQALQLKKISGVSSDTILAEDIGEFPDLNLC